MTKTKKIPIGLVLFLLIGFGLYVKIGNLTVTQGGATGNGSNIKNLAGDCVFILHASWKPEARNDVGVTFRLAGMSGSPRVHMSPWSITRTAPCRSDANVSVTQNVYSGHQAGCKITVNRVIVSRQAGRKTNFFQCAW